jgi:predicted nuclease of predicted toxin-antitoxin system
VILVADEGVDAPIVEALRRDGHEVHYVAEMDPGLRDEEVLETAVRRRALLVTSDKGFGELVFLQHREVPGVLLMRLAGLGLATKARLVTQAVREHGAQLADAFSVLRADSIRIRRRT